MVAGVGGEVAAVAVRGWEAEVVVHEWGAAAADFHRRLGALRQHAQPRGRVPQ